MNMRRTLSRLALHDRVCIWSMRFGLLDPVLHESKVNPRNSNHLNPVTLMLGL
jgi:hypothetical protein